MGSAQPVIKHITRGTGKVQVGIPSVHLKVLQRSGKYSYRSSMYHAKVRAGNRWTGSQTTSSGSGPPGCRFHCAEKGVPIGRSPAGAMETEVEWRSEGQRPSGGKSFHSSGGEPYRLPAGRSPEMQSPSGQGMRKDSLARAQKRSASSDHSG